MNRLQLDTFTRLVGAAADVASQLDLRAVLRTTAEVAREATGAQYAAIGVIGDHGTLVDFVYSGMSQEEADRIGRPPVGKGVLGALITDPHPVRIDDISGHPSSSGFPPEHPAMETFLGVPVKVGEKVFGNLYLAEKEGGFSSEDEQVVVALAAIAGGAVSAARLHERVTRAAVAEDRERIARDLHDAVIQDLFAVGLALQGTAMSVEDEKLSNRLDDAVESIDDAISALRTFIFDIRTLGATLADPEGTIRRMVHRLTASSSATTTVEIGPLAPASAEALDDVLQIVRECVSNAVRHADATAITVSVAMRDEDVIVAVVSDDGCGFDKDTVRRGMGLDNLVDRVSASSGELAVETAPGVGTTVTATLPL